MWPYYGLPVVSPNYLDQTFYSETNTQLVSKQGGVKATLELDVA